MDRIYHGCFTKHADVTKKIIAKGEKCIVPTDECFWKDPVDVTNGVKTRSHAKNEPIATYKDYDRCTLLKQFTSCWVLGKEKKNN